MHSYSFASLREATQLPPGQAATSSSKFESDSSYQRPEGGTNFTSFRVSGLPKRGPPEPPLVNDSECLSSSLPIPTVSPKADDASIVSSSIYSRSPEQGTYQGLGPVGAPSTSSNRSEYTAYSKLPQKSSNSTANNTASEYSSGGASTYSKPEPSKPIHHSTAAPEAPTPTASHHQQARRTVSDEAFPEIPKMTSGFTGLDQGLSADEWFQKARESMGFGGKDGFGAGRSLGGLSSRMGNMGFDSPNSRMMRREQGMRNDSPILQQQPPSTAASGRSFGNPGITDNFFGGSSMMGSMGQGFGGGIRAMNDVQVQDNIYKINVPVSEYEPQEIEIKLHEKNREVEIAATHREGGSPEGNICRQFTRRYTLPPTANFDKLESVLYNGQLTIECELEREKPPVKIPINRM